MAERDGTRMELEVATEEFEHVCRRRRCLLRMTLDPAAVVALLTQLGDVRRCRLEEPVEVSVVVADFDYACNRNGCLLRLELSEREAERLRSLLVSLCL